MRRVSPASRATPPPWRERSTRWRWRFPDSSSRSSPPATSPRPSLLRTSTCGRSGRDGAPFQAHCESRPSSLLRSSRRATSCHYFDVNAPLLHPRRRFVTTFHDASLVRTVATNFPPLRRGYKRRLYQWSLPRASAIVAVSEFAKEEAVRHFGVDADRVVVIHSGPGLGSTPARLGRTAQTGAVGCSSARICSSWAT